MTLQELAERNEQRLHERLSSVTAHAACWQEQTDNTMLARCLLSGDGFDVSLPYFFYSAEELRLVVTKEQLPAVRVALGCPLVISSKRAVTPERKDDKEVVSLKQVKVEVTLRPRDFPTTEIVYLADPPKKKRGQQGKCQIKKIRHRAYTSIALVCEV